MYMSGDVNIADIQERMAVMAENTDRSPVELLKIVHMYLELNNKAQKFHTYAINNSRSVIEDAEAKWVFRDMADQFKKVEALIKDTNISLPTLDVIIASPIKAYIDSMK